MKRRIEAAFYFILVLFCIGYIISALTLRIGSFSEPGAGLIPLLYGITGLILSGVLCLTALRRQKGEGRETEGDGATGAKGGEAYGENSPLQYRKLLLLLVILAVYLVLFQLVDFLLLTFLLMLALAKIFDLEGWKKPLLMSGVFIAAVYVIFIWGFEVSF